jgi:hypothetical protein
MRVAGEEKVGVHACERAVELGPGDVRQQQVGERPGRAVKADGAQPGEIELQRPSKAAQEFELLELELRGTPLTLRGQAYPDLAFERGHAVQHPRVPVAHRDGAVKLAEAPHRLVREGPDRDVAQADQLVRAVREVGEHGVERERVAVQVGEHSHPHGETLTRRQRAALGLGEGGQEPLQREQCETGHEGRGPDGRDAALEQRRRARRSSDDDEREH